MNLAPDIELESVQIGGVISPVRTYWRPHCLRCRWTGEPAPVKEEALVSAGEHLHNGCLMDVPEADDDALLA